MTFKVERVLFRIFDNGSIRQYPLTEKEWMDIIRKNPIRGWVSEKYWHGVVIIHHPGTRARKSWTWVAIVSSTGWHPGPTFDHLEKILRIFKGQEGS